MCPDALANFYGRFVRKWGAACVDAGFLLN